MNEPALECVLATQNAPPSIPACKAQEYRDGLRWVCCGQTMKVLGELEEQGGLTGAGLTQHEERMSGFVEYLVN